MSASLQHLEMLVVQTTFPMVLMALRCLKKNSLVIGTPLRLERTRRTLQGHQAAISSLSWSAEGLLLSGSWDETARGWDLETGACAWVLSGHEVRLLFPTVEF